MIGGGPSREGFFGGGRVERLGESGGEGEEMESLSAREEREVAIVVSERARGLERVRFIWRWKSRNSRLRAAEWEEVGFARIVFAWVRREERVALGVVEGFSSSSGCGGDGDDDGAFVESEVLEEDLASRRSMRRSCRRSLPVFVAPVANKTRSGSTWNMSPGLRLYAG